MVVGMDDPLGIDSSLMLVMLFDDPILEISLDCSDVGEGEFRDFFFFNMFFDGLLPGFGGGWLDWIVSYFRSLLLFYLAALFIYSLDIAIDTEIDAVSIDTKCNYLLTTVIGCVL